MPNILSFLQKNGNSDFAKIPFCEADVLVIGLLSYANFENSSISKNNDVKNSFINVKKYSRSSTHKKITNHFLLPDKYLKFLSRFMSSKRYDDLELGYFECKNDEKIELQFFALTFKIDGKYFVTFRGTDRSVVGWKEDFNLVLMDKIPSQDDSVSYLKKMINTLNSDVYVLGHSKGGNLAYYSFFFIEEEYKNRVNKVYNLDGPGFGFDTSEYTKKYKKQLVKIVPSNDVVGVLLNDKSKLTICQSSKHDVTAHDMMSWQLLGNKNFCELKRMNELTIYSEALRLALNSYIKKIGIDKVEFIKEYIFKIVTINKVTDVITIMNNALFIIVKSFKEFKKENPNNYKEIEKLLKLFIKEYTHYLTKVQDERRKHAFNFLINRNKKDNNKNLNIKKETI